MCVLVYMHANAYAGLCVCIWSGMYVYGLCVCIRMEWCDAYALCVCKWSGVCAYRGCVYAFGGCVCA